MPIFDTGTKTFFQQTAAPTGWTKDTTYDNAALRVVSGSTSSGGSSDFTSVFTSKSFSSAPFPVDNVGSFTLATPNLNNHTHTTPPSPSAGRVLTPANSTPGTSPTPTPTRTRYSPTLATSTTGNAGGGGSHDHSFSVSVSGSVGNMSVRYVDIILASKN
jgi:hypothetical protein